MDSARVLVERGWVDEERGNEVNRVVARELWVLRELGLPAVRDSVLTEFAGLARKGGGERTTVVFELVGVRRVLLDVVAQSACIVRRRTRQNANCTE